MFCNSTITDLFLFVFTQLILHYPLSLLVGKKIYNYYFFKGAIFGALYAPFVITGLHHMTNVIDLELVRTAGGTSL